MNQFEITFSFESKEHSATVTKASPNRFQAFIKDRSLADRFRYVHIFSTDDKGFLTFSLPRSNVQWNFKIAVAEGIQNHLVIK